VPEPGGPPSRLCQCPPWPNRFAPLPAPRRERWGAATPRLLLRLHILCWLCDPSYRLFVPAPPVAFNTWFRAWFFHWPSSAPGGQSRSPFPPQPCGIFVGREDIKWHPTWLFPRSPIGLPMTSHSADASNGEIERHTRIAWWGINRALHWDGSRMSPSRRRKTAPWDGALFGRSTRWPISNSWLAEDRLLTAS